MEMFQRPVDFNRPIGVAGTCRTGGLCRVVAPVTVVYTVETCLIIVAGVTARFSSDAAGACGTEDERDLGTPHCSFTALIHLKQISPL